MHRVTGPIAALYRAAQHDLRSFMVQEGVKLAPEDAAALAEPVSVEDQMTATMVLLAAMSEDTGMKVPRTPCQEWMLDMADHFKGMLLAWWWNDEGQRCVPEPRDRVAIVRFIEDKLGAPLPARGAPL